MAQVFLTTTGANQWTVPSDRNDSANTIEVIGGGGSGVAVDYSVVAGGGATTGGYSG